MEKESTLTKQDHAILEKIEKNDSFDELKDLYYSLYPPAWGGVLSYKKS